MPDRDRYARGLKVIEQMQGPEATATILDGLAAVHPDLPGYVVEDGFADVYARPGLDLGRRQLVTVTALATLGGCERQLAVHVRGALNLGISPEELFEALLQVGVYAGVPRALNAIRILREVQGEAV
ncbi:MAG: carboxymuconolactone decarboxylase family protein [Solirubrobacteraceae bacterium]